MIGRYFYLILMRNCILESSVKKINEKTYDLYPKFEGMNFWLQPVLDELQIKCCLILVFYCDTQVSVHGKRLTFFML